MTLLAVEKAVKQAIGLVVLFEAEDGDHLRLGYMLHESAWGRGFASELIRGLVLWCRHHHIHSISGGVGISNTASRRVLEKCGFLAEPQAPDAQELLFTLRLK